MWLVPARPVQIPGWCCHAELSALERPPELRSTRGPQAYLLTTTGRRLETLIRRPLMSVIAHLLQHEANRRRIQSAPAVVAARYRRRSVGIGDEPTRSRLAPSKHGIRLRQLGHRPDRAQRTLGSCPSKWRGWHHLYRGQESGSPGRHRIQAGKVDIP